MATMTMIQALRSAMDVMLERDDGVVVFGEDVGYFGGVFRCTDGLQAKYGTSRVFDAPISEGGIVGTAIGMAAYGLRPVVEVQFADYFYPAYDQIVQGLAGVPGDAGVEVAIAHVPRGERGGELARERRFQGRARIDVAGRAELARDALEGESFHEQGAVLL